MRRGQKFKKRKKKVKEKKEHTIHKSVNWYNFRMQIKNLKVGTSLVVQWIILCTPNAGGPGLIPGRELDPTCMPQLRSQ